jgi:hypothetical protein
MEPHPVIGRVAKITEAELELGPTDSGHFRTRRTMNGYGHSASVRGAIQTVALAEWSRPIAPQIASTFALPPALAVPRPPVCGTP